MYVQTSYQTIYFSQKCRMEMYKKYGMKDNTISNQRKYYGNMFKQNRICKQNNNFKMIICIYMNK